MHRSYCPHANFSLRSIRITDANEIHHIKDVLRLKVGDALGIFNSRSQEAKAKITAVKAGEIEVGIQSVHAAAPVAGVRVILACAVPKKSKFEFIIEKCTELGVDEIIPLKTKRTEVFFSKDKEPFKQARFQKVAINAAKQSGRRNVPKIYPSSSLENALKLLTGKDTLALIPSLNGQPKHIGQILKEGKAAGSDIRNIVIFIGPEGDFTPEEVLLAIEYGCIPVSLGETVLKVDTAAITTVALCKHLLYNCPLNGFSLRGHIE